MYSKCSKAYPMANSNKGATTRHSVNDCVSISVYVCAAKYVLNLCVFSQRVLPPGPEDACMDNIFHI